MSCKFCQIAEGQQGRTGRLVHINRDGLCGPCATLLDKVKYQPEKVNVDDKDWFDRQCLLNHQRGLFVPVTQRKVLRVTHPRKWSCKHCGTTRTIERDEHYTNYCTLCAEEIRCNRSMPVSRRRRSDYEGKHRSDKRSGAYSKSGRGIRG